MRSDEARAIRLMRRAERREAAREMLGAKHVAATQLLRPGEPLDTMQTPTFWRRVWDVQ